jgi:ParB family chromosome partitioning protein
MMSERMFRAGSDYCGAWLAPTEYVDAARAVMGGIDLDPAAAGRSQEIVSATVAYPAAEGLEKPWRGRVWLCPPGHSWSDFTEKLCDGLESGEVSQAVALVNNATETRAFARLAGLSVAGCFVRGRIRFLGESGLRPIHSPIQGQAVLYSGGNVYGFRDAFEVFGSVWGNSDDERLPDDWGGQADRRRAAYLAELRERGTQETLGNDD